MSEQDSTASGLNDAAAENAPEGADGERPASGAERRVDPAQPTPAANQRSGERRQDAPADVPGRTAPDVPAAPGTSETVGAASVAVPVRSHGESDAGSPAAASGEIPARSVEQLQDDADRLRTDERPVTGVHRPAAPSGEVSPH
jgi:hypothetical protein